MSKLQALTQNLIKDKLAGITIHWQASGEYSVRYVVLTLKDGSAEITENGTDLAVLAKKASGLLDTIPVSVCMTGSGILHKVTRATEATLSDTFPTFNLDDFYGDRAVYNDQAILSLARKDRVDEVLSELTGLGLFVVQCHVGATPVFKSGSAWLSQQPEWRIGPYSVGTAPVQVTPNETVEPATVELEGESLDAELVLPLYTAVCAQSGQPGIELEALTRNDAEQRFVRLNKRVIPALVALFLVVLLANYSIFNARSKALNDALQVNRSMSSELQDIREQQSLVEQRSRLLGVADKNPRLAILLDAIGTTVPGPIVLENLAIAPITSDLTDPRKPLVFADDRMVIRGFSGESEAFSQWMIQLAQLPFVEDVSIVDFRYNDRKRMYPFEVNMEVAL